MIRMSRFVVDEMLARHPHIDPEQLEAAMEYSRKLRAQGLGKAGYNLATPDTQRKVIVGESGRNDPRTIHLRQPR